MDDSKVSTTIINKLHLYLIYCFIGSILTIYLVIIGINPIISSCIVSIMIAFFTITINDEHHLSWAGFCGSFAGMTTTFLINWNNSESFFTIYFLFYAVLLSLFTSLLYTLSEYLSFKFPKVFFDGYGGRLGTIAFLSVFIFLLFGKLFFVSNIEFFSFETIKINFSFYDFLAIPSAILASLISMEIKNTVSSLNENYKVVTVSTTGLIGGIILTRIPDFMHPGIGLFIGMAWYTGAFVGMSSYFVLMLKRDFIFSGAISGILLIITKNFFIGFGGKLGFLSFLAVLITKAFYSVYAKITELRHPEEVIASLKQGDNVSNQTVDDDYAQKLVESLMKAKNSGENINLKEENIAGSYVIGEKIDVSAYATENSNKVINLDYLTETSKSHVLFFNELGISKWVFFGNYNDNYMCVSYQGLTDETVNKAQFNVNGQFINLLKKEKRIMGFSDKGINQKIFTSKFSKNDLIDTKMLIIYPVFESGEINGFFILLEKRSSIVKSNMTALKRHYEQFITNR